MYFPLFLPLWDHCNGNKGISFFSHCLPLYQAALLIPAWLFLWSEHRHSLWYWHLSALTVPAHPLVLLRLLEGYLCRCGATLESEILKIHPVSVQFSCKQFLMYLAVPDFRSVLSRQRIFHCNPQEFPLFHPDDRTHSKFCNQTTYLKVKEKYDMQRENF